MNLIDRTTKALFTLHAASLPDWSNLLILTPHAAGARALRTALLHESQKQGYAALLGPQILPFRQWLDETCPINLLPRLSDAQRLLWLVNVLKQYPSLYGQGSPWLLAQNLMSLFDELSTRSLVLIDDLTEFKTNLQQAYAFSQHHADASLTWLDREAALVHSLWKAWQSGPQQQLDKTQSYVTQLHNSPAQIFADTQICLMGLELKHPAERAWQSALMAEFNTTLIPLFDEHETSPAHLLLNAALHEDEMPFSQRAQQFAQQYPEHSQQENWTLCVTHDFEHQAHAIAQHVIHLKTKNINNIGIVTEDRRFARRLRALLERQKISLRDHTGWAYSTTRVAAFFEYWLQCIEEDFPHTAFLDILKTPAMLSSRDEHYAQHIYRFEQDIILRENIGSGLQRYKLALKKRRERLAIQQQHYHLEYRAIDDLLSEFENIAKPLKKLKQTKNVKLDELIKVLLSSLEQLNVREFFSQDAAGAQLLELLTTLHAEAIALNESLQWHEFRIWLRYVLEHNYFHLDSDYHGVELLTLEQARGLAFEQIIIAGANAQQFPGDSQQLTFFNDRVRKQLGLSDWPERRTRRQQLFCRLLTDAKHSLIIWQTTQDGAPQEPSPWLLAIDKFHELAYGTSLIDIAAPLFKSTPFNLLSNNRPAPSLLTPQLLPDDISVSAHQRLITCPYRFFMSDVLRLKAPDTIKEMMAHDEYGRLVHQALHLFHQQLAANEIITAEHANVLLQDISKNLFNQRLEANFLHHGWLQRWLNVIPAYIEWQYQRNVDWQVIAMEQAEAQQLSVDPALSIHGTIDRIDKQSAGESLIDYKTGALPNKEAVYAGENVQLSSYQWLRPATQVVNYVSLKDEEKIRVLEVEGDTLKLLANKTQQRLINIFRDINAGVALTATGVPKDCAYCDARALCREPAWRRTSISK
ncbi:MAG: PD-(D/E)XK nuclease family protein [Gammaproteobacteria bacterium]|nr:PD-(D/E)XK nuclease family protein [Gammaproteobacteria bacterium]